MFLFKRTLKTKVVDIKQKYLKEANLLSFGFKMIVKLENPSDFSKTIEIISELVTEVKIRFNDYGMSITAMDPANVAMVSFKIPKNAFSEFNLPEGNTEVLGVNLDDFKRILKRCGSAATLVFEKKDNVLEIKIIDKIKRNFSLSLIDIDAEDKEVPNLEFSSRVEMESSDLVNSLEDCMVVSDACSFIISNGKFIIEARGMNSASSEFSEDEAKIDAEDCKARYSLEYLQKFIKAAKISDKVVLQFATDHPLRMDFKGKGMEIAFILAPRVEVED